MKTLILFLSVLAASATPSAHAREDVNNTILNQLKSEGIEGDLRVYVSRKVVAKYSKTTENTNSTDNGKYNSVNRKEVLRDVINHSIRGKIVDSAVSNDDWQPVYTLYVSFNTACQDKSCALTFTSYDGDSYTLQSAPAALGDKSLSEIKWRNKGNVNVVLQYKKKELNQVITKSQHERGF